MVAHLLQDYLTSETIAQFSEPANVKQLRSYFGLLNFYSPFLPNISTVSKPLRQLTEENAIFNFSPECKLAFEKSKEILLNSKLLVRYDPSKKRL